MQADLEQDLSLESGRPLYHHMLLHVGEQRWFWYQRYHHLLVDGFNFPAITRRIAAIYTAWRRGETPLPSPFTPFIDVINEYQCYQQSDACTRDARFWQTQLAALPPSATFSDEPLCADRSTTALHRLKLTFDRGETAALMAHTQGQTLADMALALIALWLGRLSGRNAFSTGFIFMRRIGSSALCATGPVLNVLPLGIHLDLAATLPELAAALNATLRYGTNIA